jgi:hypothetical protein
MLLQVNTKVNEESKHRNKAATDRVISQYPCSAVSKSNEPAFSALCFGPDYVASVESEKVRLI